MTTWPEWAVGVLRGIGAPFTNAAYEALWAWFQSESAGMFPRWNNPLNTTENWPGSRDSGAQPGAHDVQIYASLQDGCDATVYTLVQEPYYGAIVTSLRIGLPRQQWGTAARSQLNTWGTGTAWLTRTFSAPPAPPAFSASGGSLTNMADETLRAESPYPAQWTLPVDPATRVVSSYVQFPNLVAIDFDVAPDGSLWIIGADKEGPGGFGLWYVAPGSNVARCLQGDAVRVRVGPDCTAYVLTADGHLYHRTGGGGIEAKAPMAGPQGPKGDTGSTGATGSQGIPGQKGDKGDKGDTGQTGPQGTSPKTGTIIGPINVQLS